MPVNISLQDINNARERIKKLVHETPLEYSKHYSDLTGAEVSLKLENLQITGSFKIRGALNVMLALNPEEREKGVITASAGNHGQGIAYASKSLNIPATVIVPTNTPQAKIDAIQEYRVLLRVAGRFYDEAEKIAINHAKVEEKHYISPYNHPDVITGQGTIGLEILDQDPEIDAVLIPVGGGGLFSGVSIAIKEQKPGVKCYGVQSEASPVFHESLKQGKIVDIHLEDSIAEGLHGGIEKGSITFDYVKKYCEEILLVNEQEIKDAMVEFNQQHNMVCEGAGAVGLAAIKRYNEFFKGKKIVIVVTGANLDVKEMKDLLFR
ncbi:MAG: threonine/serine dehydratase [Candidatus Hodarchaeota archaeon]